MSDWEYREGGWQKRIHCLAMPPDCRSDPMPRCYQLEGHDGPHKAPSGHMGTGATGETWANEVLAADELKGPQIDAQPFETEGAA